MGVGGLRGGGGLGLGSGGRDDDGEFAVLGCFFDKVADVGRVGPLDVFVGCVVRDGAEVDSRGRG